MFLIIALNFLSIFANWWHTSAFDPNNETIYVQKTEGYAGRVSDTCFVVASGTSLAEVCVTYLYSCNRTELPYKFERNVITSSTYKYATYFVDDWSRVYKVTKDNNNKINVDLIGSHTNMFQFFNFGNIGVGCSMNMLEGCLYCVDDKCTTKHFDFDYDYYVKNGYYMGFIFPDYASDTLYMTINVNTDYAAYFLSQNVKSWSSNDLISTGFAALSFHQIKVAFPYGLNAFILGDDNHFASLEFKNGELKTFSNNFVNYYPGIYQGAFAITGVNYPYIEWVTYGSGGVNVLRSFAQCGKNQFWDKGICRECLSGHQCILTQIY